MRLKLVGCALAVLGLMLAQVTRASEIQREVVASRFLNKDLPFLVYVPSAYAESSESFPVLYLLHGFGDNERAWVDRGSIQSRADALIASGAIPPALIVMPGCARCWWAEGPRDRAETAFWSDLVPKVASLYRTIDNREGRLIAGFSAGGYGAIHLALKYPDRIGAAAAFSPAIYAETPPPSSAARIYSPFVGLDGKFNQAAWSEQNYPRLIEPYFAQGRRVPMYLVAGDSDRFGIAFETALLYKKLFEKQPDLAELRIVDGGHSWQAWASAIDGALIYLFRFSARPAITARTSPNGLAQRVESSPVTP